MAIEDSSTILIRFNRLMRDLEQGETKRNTFHPWEVELLIDLGTIDWKAPGRRKTLERYRRAVERRLAAGESRPLKFSEYIAASSRSRAILRFLEDSCRRK
jgi:hypothetical protein